MARWMGTWAVCLGLCGFANLACAAESNGAAVVVVLDCSLRMAESFDGGSAAGDATRFNAARAALISTVNAAAGQENVALGVVCFGHRLAWDEGEQPDLVEQADYLSQTAGFAAISSLVPGNDVEVLRRPLRLSEQDARFATPILETLRPWGEAPLNRAMVLANRQFGGASSGGMLVITARGDKIGQGGAKYTRQQILEGYYKHRMPIHVVAVGAAEGTKDAAWSDLQLVARRSRGSFQPVASPSELQQAVRQAYDAIVAGEQLPVAAAPRTAETLPRPATATPIADARAIHEPAPTNSVVEGVVLYYGRPLPKARVTIDGLAAPAATADSTGEFRFTNVPPGRYEVSVIGSAHHRPYSGKATLIVPERADEPLFMEFDLR